MKLRRGRSHKIIEKEMQRARKEIPKEETYNCYGNAARKVAIRELEERGTLLRAMSKDTPKDEVFLWAEGLFTQSNISH